MPESIEAGLFAADYLREVINLQFYGGIILLFAPPPKKMKGRKEEKN